MYIKEQNKSITHGKWIDQSVNQSWNLICGAPTKAHSILHELVPQIPLFWNYENSIRAYIKSRETEDYLKPEEN